MRYAASWTDPLCWSFSNDGIPSRNFKWNDFESDVIKTVKWGAGERGTDHSLRHRACRPRTRWEDLPYAGGAGISSGRRRGFRVGVTKINDSREQRTCIGSAAAIASVHVLAQAMTIDRQEIACVTWSTAWIGARSRSQHTDREVLGEADGTNITHKIDNHFRRSTGAALSRRRQMVEETHCGTSNSRLTLQSQTIHNNRHLTTKTRTAERSNGIATPETDR